MKRLLAARGARAGLILLILLIAAGLMSGLLGRLMGMDSTTLDLGATLAPPSVQHLLGTDEVGRDLLLRLLEGAKVSLAVGLATAILAAVIGTVIGIAAGYLGGALDAVLMRFTDGVVALPLLPLLIVLAALDPAKLGFGGEFFRSPWAGLLRTIVIIALVGWTTVARLVRAATLSVRTREFVRAAESMGARPIRIMLRHVLPNVASPLLVATALSIGNIILLESGLSFLGLGVQPPLPSWGNMLSSALNVIFQAPALALWPGIMIFLTVLSFNLLADGLQHALDPRAMVN
jgi:peptide/nickel transport system permease protein